MEIIDVVLGFLFSMLISSLVTMGAIDCTGDCFFSRLIAVCSFGSSMIILIASIVLMFI